MSLILDALRKMELERKAKRLSSAEIRTEVLNYRGNPPAPGKSRLLSIIAALLLFSSGAALFFYLQGSDSPKAEPVKAAAQLPVDNPPHPATQKAAPLPLPPAQTVHRAETNGASTAPRPAAKTEESQQPLGNDSTITVSGIAWQEERSLRRAVINGFLVSEGAEISGAKIVEIRENLVRFSRGGRTFEIFYSSGPGR